MDSTNLINKFQPLQALRGKAQGFYDEKEEDKRICSIYPATLGIIADLEKGIDTYLVYLRMVTFTKEELLDSFKNFGEEFYEKIKDLNILELFFLLYSMDETSKRTIEDAFFFFIKEYVFFVPNLTTIFIGNIKDKRTLTVDNFIQFQNIIRYQNWVEVKEEEEEVNFNPATPKAREILEKIRKGREEVAKIKSKANGKIKFHDLVASLAAKGNGLGIVNIWSISYYAFYDQLQRMSMVEEYDMLIKSALAGAKIDKNKLKKHWIRGLSIEPSNGE